MKRLLPALALLGAPPAQGPQVAGAAGRTVRLRGANVGGWLLQESYLLNANSLGAQGRMRFSG